MSCMTCAAVVGLGRPDRLAEGAAMGRAQARSMAAATGWLGMRTATVDSPAVTTSGRQGFLGHSTVSGPGQKADMSFSANGGTVQNSSS